jgi:hypothetical protein
MPALVFGSGTAFAPEVQDLPSTQPRRVALTDAGPGRGDGELLQFTCSVRGLGSGLRLVAVTQELHCHGDQRDHHDQDEHDVDVVADE